MSSQIHGELIFSVMVAFAVAVPLAVPMLALIRWRMRKHMECGGRVAAFKAATGVAALQTPLRLELVPPPERPSSPAAEVLLERMREARAGTAVIYAMAGMAAAAIMAYTDTVNGGGMASKRFLPLLFLHSWPVVITVFAVAVPSYRVKRIALPLIGVSMFLVTWAISGSPLLWLALLGPPTLLLLLSANLSLKNVAPLLAMLVFLFTLAFNAAVDVLKWRIDAFALALIVFIAAILGGLLLIALIVRAYRRKRVSDLSFQLAFLWSTFCGWYMLLRASAGYAWAGLLALAVYFVITRIATSLLRRAAERQHAAGLLVLRVFGSPSRGLRLFSELGTQWRTIGPLQLIAGTDSAIANLDLLEAVRYLTFRFKSLYVADAADLDRRMEQLDVKPDRDGTYRTNNFFCFAGTWRATFTRLLERSYAVLVDLGGYTSRNEGVAFEIGQLLARRPLSSFVLITDEKTVMPDLQTMLADAWSRLDPSLPNAKLATPVLRILHRPGAKGLLTALADATVAAGWQPGTIRSCSSISTLSPRSSITA